MLPAAFSEADQAWMARALALAAQAVGHTEPNPRVGCVLVRADGQLLGEGRTQAAGQAHAEVMALRDARSRGLAVAGATAYVTLEPCAHYGRTPPCCDALVAAGVGRVVAALEDPNPRVAGQGLARLQAAGIAVQSGLMAEPATALNIGFLHRMRTGRPFVRLKWAASLDARTALPDGQSQWITGEAARADGRRWRRRAAAVLTGLGTVRDDDPRLDVRLEAGEASERLGAQPLRVVADSAARLPLGARILQPPGAVLVAHAPCAAPAHLAALAERGVACWSAPSGERTDLAALLDELGRREVNELHVEAGATLNGALLAAGLVDELLLYLAPTLLGPGREVASLPSLASLAQATHWRWVDVQPVGADLRLRLQR